MPLNKNTRDKHKIKKLWDMAIEIAAIENEILKRLDSLEESSKLLAKKIATLQE
jgi:hypothetical protein